VRSFALFAALAPGMLLGQMQVAPGSLATIGYESNATVSTPPSATVSLRAVGSSTVTPAQVVSVGPQTISFVVPPNAPLGPAQLIYKAAGGTTNWVAIDVVPASFTISAAEIVAVNGNARANSLSQPAQSGEAVALWGAGLGTTPFANVSVTFGGVAQKILYAGPAPGLAGVDQINFQVSAGTPDGCYLPVSVDYGAGSAVTYLSKSSNGGPCPHPFHLSASDLANLDAGGALDVGQIQTASNIVAVTGDHASRQESASVSFSQWDASYIAAEVEGGSFAGNFGSTDLSVGTQVLSAINVSSAVVFPASDSPLASLPPPVLKGGSWTWSNSGGASLAPSSFSFPLPPPIQIQGTVPLMWASGQDQTITWNPAGYDSGAILQASLSGATGGGIEYGGIVGLVAFPMPATLAMASAPASAGTLTFSSQLLSQVGPGALTLTVQVTEPFASRPAMPLQETNGNTLLMIVSASTSERVPVDIQ
jgi:uncharacterized protein (TIGR03437 family)